jgi:hypothetical protein
MAESRHPPPSPSDPDGGGVRIVRKPRTVRSGARLWTALLLALVVATAAGVWWRATRSKPDATVRVTTVGPTAAAREADDPQHTAPRMASMDAAPSAGTDPDDLAAYFQPGDPEPTGAQVIQALQQAGIRTGLGAFNPPGTSPPLEGLAVPDNFDLPEGYVRHHQVTDEGVPIEPILMFSPDFTLYDARGRAIEMPANRVVPPELAPPGMPLRRVRVR